MGKEFLAFLFCDFFPQVSLLLICFSTLRQIINVHGSVHRGHYHIFYLRLSRHIGKIQGKRCSIPHSEKVISS